MSRTPSGSPKARNLGAELRKTREDVGISARKLAQKLAVARARVQRWENGSTVPTPEDVASYLALLAVNGTERDRLLELARDVDNGNWITSDVPGIRAELTTLIECERTCTSIVDVSPLLVPGLLQTAEYIRSVMVDLEVDDIGQRVMYRLGRQNILTQRRAPEYTVFISEGVLREPIGGSEVMVEQLGHIIASGRNRNVHVHVIPSAARKIHPAHLGSYVLFRFPKAAPIVHLEHYRSAGFLYGTRDVSAYEHAEELLRVTAMSESDSLALIADIATEMKG